MTEIKTKPTGRDAAYFLDSIEDPGRREDCKKMAGIIEEITGSRPVMWGESIVGFGDYHYKYASGREGDWFLCGFSPRKQNLTIYIMGYLESYNDILEGLGKYKHGKGCLYIKRLTDVDQDVLRNLIAASVQRLQETT